MRGLNLDVTTIRTYMQTMAGRTGRWSDYHAAWEIAAALTVRYVPLQLGTINTNQGSILGENFRSTDVVSFDSRRPVQLVVNFPVNPLRQADYLFPATDPFWLNLVLMGLRTVVMSGEPSSKVTWWFMPQSSRYVKYIARAYAATFDTLYLKTGMTVAMWNSFQGPLVQFTKQYSLMRNFFISVRGDDYSAYAGMTVAIYKLFCGLLEMEPAREVGGCRH